jgi:phenylacetate-CoA ligase
MKREFGLSGLPCPQTLAAGARVAILTGASVEFRRAQRGKRLHAASEDFEALERLDREALARRSSERLESLLRHAFQRVPHYREALSRQGITDAGELYAEDLGRFPVLTRGIIRDEAASGRLLADGLPRRRRVPTHTSGSTGMPLFFYGDAQSRRPRFLGWRLLDRWAGIQRGDARVWMTVPRPRPPWSPRRPLSSWWKRFRFRQPPNLLSVYKLRAEDVAGVVETLGSRDKPYFIYGIGSSIHFIAERALASGLRLDRTPRTVIGTSDTFVDHQRRTVSELFGCPAYSRYGAYEVGGGVAQTCPDNPKVHHVLSELVVAEVVDEDLRPVAPGKRGRVLLTDLTNRAMPLIRYDIGDLAISADGCSCGRPWPVVGEVFGRTADRLLLKSGRSRATWELETALFYESDFKADILEFQFVQRGAGVIEMRVVPKREVPTETLERIREAVVRALGEETVVEVSLVERIEQEPSGKRRLVVQAPPIR